MPCWRGRGGRPSPVRGCCHGVEVAREAAGDGGDDGGLHGAKEDTFEDVVEGGAGQKSLELQGELCRSLVPGVGSGKKSIDFGLEGGLKRLAKSIADVLVRVGAEGTVQKRRKFSERVGVEFREHVIVLGV